MELTRVGLALMLCLATTGTPAERAVPELRYDPPPNFYRSAIHPPDDFTANGFNASLQVYPFRPFNANIEQQFQQTLLRDWLDPRFMEQNVASQPVFAKVAIPGAQAAFTAQFVENTGLLKQHMRMLIVVGNAAAIVDASASSPETWQRAGPALNAFAATLRVEAGEPAPDMNTGPGPGGAKVAGLYMGTKSKYVPDPNKPVGVGKHVMAMHYYLFSASGRVYCAYDALEVPGGDPARFDFDTAESNDSRNSGRYTLKDKQIIIRFSGQPPETIIAPAPDRGRLRINSVLYIKQ